MPEQNEPQRGIDKIYVSAFLTNHLIAPRDHQGCLDPGRGTGGSASV